MPSLNYVDYDYDNLKSQLVGLLRSYDTWKDVNESSTGMTFMEWLAYLFNMRMYYLERRAQESYIGTARHKSSIIELVRLIGYTPKRCVSATGTLTFSVTGETNEDRIYIPMYTEVQTVNAVKFVTMNDITIEPGQLSNSVAAIQGVLVEEQFIGDGTEDQEIPVNNTLIENDTHTKYRPFHAFRVIVDGIEWTKVTSFLASASDDKHYVIRPELNDTITIVFGDGVNGLIPTDGSVIQVKYIQSSGASGNVYETGRITTINTAIYNESGEDVTLAVTNITSMFGGDDAEDKEEIRVEAPQVFQTGERAVTKRDYMALIMNYDSVADVNVWGEAEEDPPNYNMFNVVRICILLGNWQHPDDGFKNTLASDLQSYSMLTVKYEFIQAVILDVIVELDAKVVKGYSISNTQAEINTTLSALFVLGTTTKLGVSKYLSNLIDAVDTLLSVDYHHMVLKVRKGLTNDHNSLYSYSETLDAIPVRPSTINVYATVDGIEDVLLAQDDGLGVLTDVSSVYTISGAVDYITGEIGMDVTPDTGISNVYVKYEQDRDGDVMVTTRQICKLYEVDITSIGY